MDVCERLTALKGVSIKWVVITWQVRRAMVGRTGIVRKAGSG